MTKAGHTSCLRHHRGSLRCCSTCDLRACPSTTFLILLPGAWRRCKISNRWHLDFRSRCLHSNTRCTAYIVWFPSYIAQHRRIFRSLSCSSLSFGLSGRFGQELFEVLEKVWSGLEEFSNLRINILNGFGFSLIRLQDFEKLLIYLRLRGETILVVLVFAS